MSLGLSLLAGPRAVGPAASAIHRLSPVRPCCLSVPRSDAFACPRCQSYISSQHARLTQQGASSFSRLPAGRRPSDLQQQQLRRSSSPPPSSCSALPFPFHVLLPLPPTPPPLSVSTMSSSQVYPALTGTIDPGQMAAHSSSAEIGATEWYAQSSVCQQK